MTTTRFYKNGFSCSECESYVIRCLESLQSSSQVVVERGWRVFGPGGLRVLDQEQLHFRKGYGPHLVRVRLSMVDIPGIGQLTIIKFESVNTKSTRS